MAKKAAKNYIYQYYQGIVDGSICVGEWIRRLYEYVVGEIGSGALKFDQKKANAAIDWIEEHCHHTEGPLAPGKIKLELWQKATLSCIFGIVDPKTGLRQFREIVLIVARKNGKSLFASAIANYTFFLDGGYGNRIYCLAPKLDQAEIIYNDIWTMILLEPSLKFDKTKPKEVPQPNTATHRMTDLFIADTNSTVKKIAFSAKKSDGFNPSLTICDEIASWSGEQGLRQYEVMKSGMGARPEGLLLSCSTSGYINDSIYDELLKRATRFLLGDSKEKRLLPFLYMIDDVEKWNDINELQKSNPNLGVSVSVDYLLEEVAVAEGSLSKKAEFICKYCNIKQNASTAWLAATDVEKAFLDISLEDFRGCYCVGGIDLSRTTDLTACLALIEKDGVMYVFSQFFLPSEVIQDATARDGLPYGLYVKQGYLMESGDNVVDYNDCFNWFRDLIEDKEIYPLEVGYDRYSSAYLVSQMENYGFHMDDVLQGFNLTGCINDLEGLIKDGKIKFATNELMKAHLLDAALKVDAEESKRKLVKLRKEAHIDGVAALLDAICMRRKYANEIGAQLEN